MSYIMRYEIVRPHLTKSFEAACGTALASAKVALWSREVAARFVEPAVKMKPWKMDVELRDRENILVPWNEDGVSARLVQVISDQKNRSSCKASAGTLVGGASGPGVAARAIFSSRSFGYRAT
jgi:hypothetical protein